WNAALPSARTTVEVSIGFPEMQFSDDLVARIRSADHIEPAVRAAELSTTVQGHPNSVQSSNENGSQSANAHHDRPIGPATAFVPSGEPATNTHEEPIPGLERHCFSWDRVETRGEPGIEPDLEMPGAMLAFQETMKAFLQTQQEVMGAYFEGSTGD